MNYDILKKILLEFKFKYLSTYILSLFIFVHRKKQTFKNRYMIYLGVIISNV